jgi:hypothetical protein
VIRPTFSSLAVTAAEVMEIVIMVANMGGESPLFAAAARPDSKGIFALLDPQRLRRASRDGHRGA